MSEKRILVNGELVEADLYTWARWFENMDNRRVAETFVGDVRVSTVCLGSDHGFGGQSEWFETMVFGGVSDEECERYATLDESRRGHDLMVAKVKGQGDE